MTNIVAFDVKRMKGRDAQIAFILTLEDGTELGCTMNSALAYNFGSKLRKKIEQANQVPEGGNGEKYSNFYGMQY